mmetsp:Transcript_31679/g.74530  ORF Transcript_31679/g.74530 Transcript_31679/m.74530 type:complete len:129 (-) Transcript_31679:275-661(-)
MTTPPLTRVRARETDRQQRCCPSKTLPVVITKNRGKKKQEAAAEGSLAQQELLLVFVCRWSWVNEAIRTVVIPLLIVVLLGTVDSSAGLHHVGYGLLRFVSFRFVAVQFVMDRMIRSSRDIALLDVLR